MPDILIYLSILVLFCCYIWQLYIPLGPSKVGEGVCRHKGLKEGEVVCVWVGGVCVENPVKKAFVSP